ncbi:MAG: hypothetical protein JWR80_7482 [Bradyrhizobium sp.]|nr:hypothetical protein [Bradyrhizobium sp.]
MAQVQQIGAASDRVMQALVAGLEIEFGHEAGAALAARFLAAEGPDFHWDARVSERWLGAYESVGDEELELDRVAICGRLDGDWFAATCIVDGEGMAHGMIGHRTFRTERQARRAFAHAR